MADDAVPNAPVWAALRSWITEREALERANGSSAITPAQIDIISNLIKVEKKLEVDNTNYVGDLNQYAHKYHKGTADYSREEHVPPGAGGGGGQWRVFCKLSWNDEIFPQPGYGIVNGQPAPSFTVKKTAKQFAAQMAMVYLTNQASTRARAALMGEDVTSPAAQNGDGGPLSSPPSKRARKEAVEPGGAALSSPKDDAKAANNSDPKGRQKEIQASIRQLALRLNFQPPTYDVKPEQGRAGFFRGEAIWHNEPLAPEEPIRVEGVYGEAQTTEQLSAKVYEWLRKLHERRQGELADIMKDIVQA